jgi:hypothetical protein
MWADEPILVGFEDRPVAMPTGIAIMSQRNLNGEIPDSGFKQFDKYTASHHQKFVVTERAAYLGGLNFGREYWDTHEHVPPNTTPIRRAGSGIARTASKPDPGPLHDTGSIVRGDAILEINRLFRERWGTNSSSPWRTATAINRPFQGIRDLLHIRPGDDVDVLLAEVEAQPPTDVARPQASFDPAYTVSDIVFAESHPEKSYEGQSPVFGIRNAYGDSITSMLNTNSSLAYFENQYFQDADFAIRLFNACQPKTTIAVDATRNASWCERDPFAHLVLTYYPGASGSSFVDEHVPTIAGIVADEMKAIKWLEIKTARSIRDRLTGQPIVSLDYFPPASPGCLAVCPVDHPYVYFDDKAIDDDPATLSLHSVVDFLGTDHYEMKACQAPNDGDVVNCPIQMRSSRQVGEIITSSSFMAYTIANSGQVGEVAGSGGTPLTNLHDFLMSYGIYVHSKHSEFFHYANGELTLRYVIGSANLNPRSLGHLRPKIGFADDDDSETALFFQPAPGSLFWHDLWVEHLGADPAVPNDPGGAAEYWEQQGWDNWSLIRAGGLPSSAHRVVRLDAVGRCIGIAGAACP